MDILTALLGLHTISTIAMFGLIWFVQLVHYPLFHRVGPDRFALYESDHQRRASWVVVPLMCVEAVTSIALVFLLEAGWPWLMATLGIALVAANWLSTIFVQVPCHRRLAAAYDAEVAQRLVATNWLRTIVWTCRVPLAVALIVGVRT